MVDGTGGLISRWPSVFDRTNVITSRQVGFTMPRGWTIPTSSPNCKKTCFSRLLCITHYCIYNTRPSL